MDFELSKSIEVSALLESVLHDMEPTSSDQDSNVSEELSTFYASPQTREQNQPKAEERVFFQANSPRQRPSASTSLEDLSTCSDHGSFLGDESFVLEQLLMNSSPSEASSPLGNVLDTGIFESYNIFNNRNSLEHIFDSKLKRSSAADLADGSPSRTEDQTAYSTPSLSVYSPTRHPTDCNEFYFPESELLSTSQSLNTTPSAPGSHSTSLVSRTRHCSSRFSSDLLRNTARHTYFAPYDTTVVAPTSSPSSSASVFTSETTHLLPTDQAPRIITQTASSSQFSFCDDGVNPHFGFTDRAFREESTSVFVSESFEMDTVVSDEAKDMSLPSASACRNSLPSVRRVRNEKSRARHKAIERNRRHRFRKSMIALRRNLERYIGEDCLSGTQAMILSYTKDLIEEQKKEVGKLVLRENELDAKLAVMRERRAMRVR